jgi:hypothetical protein
MATRPAPRRAVVLVGAVVLLLGLTGADALTRHVLEERVAAATERRLESTALGDAASVTASVAGLSALTQLANGSLDLVTLAISVPVERLPDVLDRGGAGALADLAADATWTTESGSLVLTTSLTVAGMRVPVAVVLDPAVSGDDVELTPTAVRIAGRTVDAGLLAERGNRFATLTEPRRVALPNLPPTARLTGVEAVHGDLVLRAEIRDADLSGQTPGDH